MDKRRQQPHNGVDEIPHNNFGHGGRKTQLFNTHDEENTYERAWPSGNEQMMFGNTVPIAEDLPA